jgi:outer membrane protein OmpA-like peptidoglycan-associated protein
LRRALQIAWLALLLPVAAQAGVQQFGASLQESNWSARGDILECNLAQTIPGFGRAVFTAAAGGRLNLAFELEREQPARPVDASLRSMAPPWKAHIPEKSIAEVRLEPREARTAVFGRDAALRALFELEKGMFPTLTYRDWADSRDQVNVAVSAVNLRAALGNFRACIASLHPDGFRDVNDLDIRFAAARHQLDADARRTLDRIIAYMNVDPTVNFVVLTGHADDRGPADYNEELAQMRVDAVRDYLLDEGVDKERIVEIAFGERRAEYSNQTAEGRARNRRVHVVLRRSE